MDNRRSADNPANNQDKTVARVNLRHEARKLAVQTLYAWQLSENNLDRIREELFDGDFPIFTKAKAFDAVYFNELTDGVRRHLDALDNLVLSGIDRDIKQINPVELAILRIGVYELSYRQEIPFRVVLNEAIVLAKQFGAVESHKYVNGVLDKLTKELRAREMLQRARTQDQIAAV